MTLPPDTALLPTRRHDLDWLRVIAFCLLIFYHIGMFYVTWDWHVKSPHMGSAAELPMMLVNPWRLSLLFFISGVAIRFASDKTPLFSFAGSRLWRLLLPITFGLFLWVAPQAYFELRQGGEIEAGFTAFYGNYLSLTDLYSITTPTWNHLWYIVYLLAYTLILCVLIPLFRFGNGIIDRLVRILSGGTKLPWLVLLLPVIPFLIYRFTLTPHFPTTHDLVADWANHANSFTIFLLGYMIAKNDHFWASVRRVLPLVLVLIVLSMPVLGYYWSHWDTLTPETPFMNMLRVWRVLYMWWVIILLLGLAQKFLNHPSPILTWATSSVFSWYILHQTLTVSAGYYLAEMDLGVWTEFALITVATIGGSLLITELVRPLPIIRLFFGLRGKKKI